MKIYTKTGDSGETGLFGGGRVRKSSPRIQAYGSVDEANAVVGLAASVNEDDEELKKTLHKIQNDLFDIGAVLANPDSAKPSKKLIGVSETDISFLEAEIDRMEAQLTPLKTFILPGGGLLSAFLHQSRTVVRRAEREIVLLADKEFVPGEIIVYINRLSDYFFVAARWANHRMKIVDETWKKKS